MSFWHGDKLSPMARACLSSFVDQGHQVTLYSYRRFDGIPGGVEERDAENILPFTAVAHFLQVGRFALASDLIRYELLAREAGIWVDTDCCCIRPLRDEDYIFGREAEGDLGTGVLKLPADSEVLESLRGIREGFIPPWLRKSRQLRWRIRRLIGRPKPLSEMDWATTGPTALTYYARKFGVEGLAKPPAAFYPVPWSRLGPLLDEDVSLEQLITPETVVLHLYNEALRSHGPAHPNSPLGRILASASEPA